MTSQLYSRYKFDFRFNSVVRARTKKACTPHALRESDTCPFSDAAIVGACKTWVHVAPMAKRAPSVISGCTFVLKGVERNAAVTLSLKMASKDRKHSPCTNVPLKCQFFKNYRRIWKYSMAHHIRTKHAVAVTVTSKNLVALAFRSKYVVCE